MKNLYKREWPKRIGFSRLWRQLHCSGAGHSAGRSSREVMRSIWRLVPKFIAIFDQLDIGETAEAVEFQGSDRDLRSILKMVAASDVEEALRSKLQATDVEVVDISGG